MEEKLQLQLIFVVVALVCGIRVSYTAHVIM